MQAIMLTAPGVLEWRRIGIPSVQPDELLVRVEATGICGSDVAVHRGTHPYKTAPIVLGHELAGSVEAVGAAVTRFARGDRVCAASFSHCERCDSCRVGNVHLCADKLTLNYAGWHGSFAEFVTLKENMTFALPDHVDYAVGALVEPLSIGLHCVRVAVHADGRRMAILGSGNIGLCCLIAARQLGFNVVCVDVRERAGNIAVSLGATAFVDASRARPAAAVKDALGGEPADVVIIACDYPQVFDDAAAIARRGGTITVVSYFQQAPRLPLNTLVANELTVAASTLSNTRDMEEVIGWLEAGKIDPRPLITHTLPLKSAADAMAMMSDGTRRAGKILLSVAGEQERTVHA